MKNKFFNNLLLIVLSLGFIGCEDYVDYEASEGYTIVADDYFKTSADFESALIGTYDVLQWNIYSVMIGDMASNNSKCGGESATDVIGLQKIDDMLHDPVNDQLESTWKWMYEGINRANYLVENKDKLEFSRKAALFGEVHFLRAYYYFELVKIFGDVPLFTDSRLTASDSGTLSRSPKANVYAQIETDLKAAIAALPAEKSLNGRATSFTAHALLGKVYLYQDKFDEAANILEPLIGLYSLPSNLKDVFLTSGEMVLRLYLKFKPQRILTGGIGDSLKVRKVTSELFTMELEDTAVLYIPQVGVLIFQLKTFMMLMQMGILEKMQLF